MQKLTIQLDEQQLEDLSDYHFDEVIELELTPEGSDEPIQVKIMGPFYEGE